MISGYGLENLILSKAKLPKFLPLIPYYDHGWTLVDKIPPSFDSNPSEFHLCWNERMKFLFRHNKKKKCLITGSPFLFFKEKYEIKKKNNKNTLFFFSHGTSRISLDLNIEKLIDSLHNLPTYIKPIDICLHHNDISLYQPLFEKNGFKTYSVGNIYDNDFAKKFYSIISQYTQTCSNTLGSYTLYSVNLEIPFFLIGDEPTYNNFGNDKNVPVRYRVSDNKYFKKISPLFKKITASITSDQKHLAISELGEISRIDSKILREVITNSFFRIYSNTNNARSFVRALARPMLAKYKYIFE